MKRDILIKLSLFTGMLLLNSGCSFKLFNDTVTTEKIKKPMPTSQQVTPNFNTIAPECSDDINTVSACNKKPIKPQELKPKIKTNEGGEVHKLKSFQGHSITIVERKNGYIFPEYKNKVIILEMFGKNCSHCLSEMPIMNKLRRQYKGNLEIFAVQVEGKMSPMQAQALIRRYHLTYPIISGETATNLQYNIQSTYGWTGILPFILVVKNGITEFSYRGKVSYHEINSDIRSLFK
jgi:thiol-disulfide isomerase/thioredoxin